MKKTYLQPATLVANIETSSIIATSGVTGSTVYTDKSAEANSSGMVKGASGESYDVWGDDWSK